MKLSRQQFVMTGKNMLFRHVYPLGIYAVPSGTCKGKRIDGAGEWIMLHGEIPVAGYKAYAKDFNPVKYDPAAWARLAKTAGMRYIVITAKHHDGFGLFPSAVTDWDVVDATPYGRDLIGSLADAGVCGSA